MCRDIIIETRFKECPGSSKKHHTYKGGLYKHVTEVMNFARAFVQVKDLEIMTVAAIFHDRNKIYEYKLLDDGTIEKLPYRDLIGHVVGSYIYYLEQAKDYDFNGRTEEHPDFTYELSHILLSHHGRLEWRSPIEPKTKLAHLFHIADMCSMQGLQL
jgi:3'-5' exoribonuclease